MCWLKRKISNRKIKTKNEVLMQKYHPSSDIILKECSNLKMVEKIREPYQRHARNISTVSDISTTGSTGYSFWQALILRSINPNYDKRLLLELQAQYATCFLHKIVLLFTFPYCLKSQNKMVPLFLKNKKEEVIIFYVEVQTNVKFRNSVNLDKKFHKN